MFCSIVRLSANLLNSVIIEMISCLGVRAEVLLSQNVKTNKSMLIAEVVWLKYFSLLNRPFQVDNSGLFYKNNGIDIVGI